MENNRNYGFDLLKLLGIILVIFHHSKLFTDFYFHGYIFVELFFLISGFFLAHSVITKKINFKDYLKKRIIQIYPKYIIVFIIYAVFIYWGKRENPCNNILGTIIDLFLAQAWFNNLGIGLNYPCWYLSVMILGDIFIFIILRYCNKNFAITISLIITIITYAVLIFMNNGNIEVWGYLKFLYIPFLRGFSAMSCGYLIYFLSLKYKNLEISKNILWILEILCVVSVFSLLFIKCNYVVYIIILLFNLQMFITNFDESLINRIGQAKILKYIYKHQYSIFLNHPWIISTMKAIFSKLNINNKIILVVCDVAVTILFSIIFDNVYSFILKSFRKVKNEDK